MEYKDVSRVPFSSVMAIITGITWISLSEVISWAWAFLSHLISSTLLIYDSLFWFNWLMPCFIRWGSFVTTSLTCFPCFFFPPAPVGFFIGWFWIWFRVQPAETWLNAVSHISHQRLLCHLHILLQGKFVQERLWLRGGLGTFMHTACNFCLTILLLYCFFRRVTAWGKSWQRWRPSEISSADRWTLFRNTLMAVLTLCLKMSCRGIKVRPPVSFIEKILTTLSFDLKFRSRYLDNCSSQH